MCAAFKDLVVQNNAFEKNCTIQSVRRSIQLFSAFFQILILTE